MPIIGLTVGLNEEARVYDINRDYVDALVRAGATPVALPIVGDESTWEKMLAGMDGFVFTGGGDVDPALYNEEMLPFCGAPYAARDRQEWYLIRGALRLRKPFLGICRGMQVCNCVMGGTLYQDIAEQYSKELRHPRGDIGRQYAHAAALVPGTRLHALIGADTISVNSRHHQGVKALAPGLVASAHAPDGLIEAFDMADGFPAICVQWHPESLSDRYPEAQKLFDWLCERATAC